MGGASSVWHPAWLKGTTENFLLLLYLHAANLHKLWLISLLLELVVAVREEMNLRAL